jgi:hypothetical protein
MKKTELSPSLASLSHLSIQTQSRGNMWLYISSESTRTMKLAFSLPIVGSAIFKPFSTFEGDELDAVGQFGRGYHFQPIVSDRGAEMIS